MFLLIFVQNCADLHPQGVLQPKTVPKSFFLNKNILLWHLTKIVVIDTRDPWYYKSIIWRTHPFLKKAGCFVTGYPRSSWIEKSLVYFNYGSSADENFDSSVPVTKKFGKVRTAEVMQKNCFVVSTLQCEQLVSVKSFERLA